MNISAGNMSKRKLKEAMTELLARDFNYSHFITLATNKAFLSHDQMTRVLKQWDARVNRELYGPRWLTKKDELLWYFAILEKPETNPHWHLLLRLGGPTGSDLAEQYRRLPVFANAAWKRLMPSGSFDLQGIRPNSHKTIADYVSKELRYELQYTCAMMPDEFRFV